jgi:archaeosortase C (PEF-CTERM variant)
MVSIWKRFLNASHTFAPEASTKRKIIQIIAMILLFQGVSIAILSSHFGPALGILSIILGIMILAIFPPRLRLDGAAPSSALMARNETYGIRLVDFLFWKTGGPIVAIASGAALVVGVLLFNIYLSARPDIGDLDLLSMILGGLLASYPFVMKRYKVEICFALLFVAFVVVILVIPQAILSFNAGTSVSNWYVHYLLAAPFAQALNLLGIEAAAHAEAVTIVFRDGAIHTLDISTGCAGLYSFSIFVSAFLSFILVYQRLPRKTMAVVLSLGILIAYLGNLFRMIIIGVIGYYRGIDALLWAHDNVGWIVFLSWSSVFWYAVLRYADRRSSASTALEQE